MTDDNGQPYQFFKLWGASGVQEGKVFEQKERQDNNRPPVPNQRHEPQQPPQQQNTIINNNNGYDDSFDSNIPF